MHDPCIQRHAPLSVQLLNLTPHVQNLYMFLPFSCLGLSQTLLHAKRSEVGGGGVLPFPMFYQYFPQFIFASTIF